MGQCSSSSSPLRKGKCMSNSMSPDSDSRVLETIKASEKESSGDAKHSSGLVRKLSRRFSKDSFAFGRRGSAMTQKQSGSSAAFSIDDSHLQTNPLNINDATIEELMTLPGITRQLAEAIVTHRKNICGFRRPEDIALVSGVGAVKFQQIKDDICVIGLKRNASDRISIRSFKPLNVNRATIFELMTIPGMTQELAAAIVTCRDKKGPFRSLQDLQKVRSINLRYALSLRPYLTVDDLESNGKTSSVNGSFARDEVSLTSFQNSDRFSPSDEGVTFNVRRQQIEALVSALEQVDPPPSLPEGVPVGKNIFRIGSWNLDDLSCDKMKNPGVTEVVCRTILRNHFSLVMLQGVLEEAAVNQLCHDLNVQKCRRDNAVWDYLCSSSGLAIVYLNGYAILEDIISANGSLASLGKVQLVKFKVFDSDIALLNCCITSSNMERLIVEVKELEKICETQKIVAAVSCRDKEIMQRLAQDFESSFEVSDTRWKEEGHQAAEPLFDCIFYSRQLKSHFANKAGVIRTGLTHLAISKGWGWGGPASTHCPGWADFTSS